MSVRDNPTANTSSGLCVTLIFTSGIPPTTLTKTKHARNGKPTVVLAYTVKGKGVSFMENQLDWHGKAPNDAQYQQAIAELQGANA